MQFREEHLHSEEAYASLYRFVIVSWILGFVVSVVFAYGMNVAVAGLPAIDAGAPRNRILSHVAGLTLLGVVGAPAALRVGFGSAFLLAGSVSGVAPASTMMLGGGNALIWNFVLLVAMVGVTAAMVGLITRRLLSRHLPPRRCLRVAIAAGILNASLWMLIGLGQGLWIAAPLVAHKPFCMCNSL